MWLYITHQLDVSDISKDLCICQKTVRRYLTAFVQRDVSPKAQHYGPKKVIGDYEELVLLRMIYEYQEIYLHEIQHKFLCRFGVNISASTLCRSLQTMGSTRQVIRQIALQRSDEQMARFMAEVAVYDPSMLIWIDESGCDRRDSIRKRAYSLRGITPREHRLLVRGVRYSAIPIMSLSGVHDLCLLKVQWMGLGLRIL